MSLNINIDKETVKNLLEKKENNHFIPANINGNGPIEIERYFEKYTETEGKGT